MNLWQILIDNYVMLFELVGLLILLAISAHISPRVRRLTRVVIALLLFETVVFYAEVWSQTVPDSNAFLILRAMLTATKYSIYPIIMLILMQISAVKPIPKKMLAILLIPEFVAVLLFYSSQWTHWICYFVRPNNYQGGPLSWLPYFLFAFYALVFIIHNFIRFRRYSQKMRIIATYILIIPLLGVVLYLAKEVDKDYASLFTSAVVLYYLYIYIHMAQVDPLTGLLNRQSYYTEIRTNPRGITAVASVDMNELKYWNDEFGHEAGDTALRTVAEIMREHCGKGGTVYRVGGDEFMILYNNTEEAELKAAIEEMQAKMAETPYACAFGYSMKPREESVEDAIRISDGRMYENKAEMKIGKIRQRAEKGELR